MISIGKKGIGIIVVGAVVVVSISVAVTNTVRKSILRQSERQCITDEPGKAIRNDPSLLKIENVKKLEGVTGQILLLKKYDKSVTCEYILTKYYSNLGNADKAEAELAKLKSLVASGKEYGDNLKNYDTLSELEVLVKGARLRQDERQSHGVFTAPGEGQ